MAAAATGTFQWLTGHEAVLHRPDAYVGGLDPVEEESLVLGGTDGAVETVRYSMSPILMKIVDEVLVNAVDCATRDSLLRNIRCTFEVASGVFTVENDGAGIPIMEFENTGRLIPSVIFSELHAGSNFQDEDQRLTGGRNGVGVSCTNVWSTAFEVEVRDTKKRFVQRFANNLTVVHEPEVSESRDRLGIVRVRFVPDYLRLGVDLGAMAPTIEKLVHTRCAEIAICARAGAAVWFQNRRLFSKSSDLLKSMAGCATFAEETCGDGVGPGCTVCVGARTKGPDFYGFVNGIRCDSGTLTDAVRSRLVRLIGDLVKKKHHVSVRPQTVRDVLAVVCVARVVNPRFTSQAKTTLSTAPRLFGFAVELTPRFSQKLVKLGVVEEIARRESERELASSLRKTQVPRSRDVLIDKYDAALDCRRDHERCTLILTEGDSAKAFVVAGLSAIGREKHGVFPLRGVPLNVTNMLVPKMLENKEIANIFRILNIGPNSDGKGLRYGKVAICSDQDTLPAQPPPVPLRARRAADDASHGVAHALANDLEVSCRAPGQRRHTHLRAAGEPHRAVPARGGERQARLCSTHRDAADTRDAQEDCGTEGLLLHAGVRHVGTGRRDGRGDLDAQVLQGLGDLIFEGGARRLPRPHQPHSQSRGGRGGAGDTGPVLRRGPR